MPPPASPPHKRPRSPSPASPSASKRAKSSTAHPTHLLHQRLNALSDALSALLAHQPPPLPPAALAALARAHALGLELDDHFDAEAGPSNVCPACDIMLSKMCHLRRHIRTKAQKCPRHAELLADMSSMTCRRCARTFTRREDVTRHEGRCSNPPRLAPCAMSPSPPRAPPR